MRVRAGTSGYSYAPWKGSFYPEKLPAAKMLASYAERLPTVEINNTFYRMPKAEQFTKWAAETPDGFCFAVKSPRRITHDKRLADADDGVVHLSTTLAALGSKLGPVLFQLPPFLRADEARLRAFLVLLARVAPGLRAAFEFRHASWFSDGIYQTLRDGGAALCIAEAEDLSTPVQATAGWGYLRLRRQDYGDADLDRWAETIARQPWAEAFVYFKHEDEGAGPALAQKLLARIPAADTGSARAAASD